MPRAATRGLTMMDLRIMMCPNRSAMGGHAAPSPGDAEATAGSACSPSTCLSGGWFVAG